MTRFQIAFVCALLLGALALAWGSVAMFIVVLAAFLALVGLGVAFPQMRFFGPFVCRGAASRQCVALTFDDGPDATSTPALLDLLKEARVEAAFFGAGKRVAA